MFREMLRKKQQLSHAECIALLQSERRGVLSVIGDGGYPYGTPMNHYYDGERGCLYFHCGNVGHRLEALQKEPKVSFCVYEQGSAPEGEWALRVRSVVVFGRIEILEDPALIAHICTELSRKFTSDEAYIAREIAEHAHRTKLLRLVPEHISGKLVTES